MPFITVWTFIFIRKLTFDAKAKARISTIQENNNKYLLCPVGQMFRIPFCELFSTTIYSFAMDSVERKNVVFKKNGKSIKIIEKFARQCAHDDTIDFNLLLFFPYFQMPCSSVEEQRLCSQPKTIR